MSGRDMTGRDAGLFAGPVVRVGRARTAAQPRDLRAIAAELRRLETMAARLTIHRNDPERFFIERSELKAGLAALAGRLASRLDP
jgi:hypothetical protein